MQRIAIILLSPLLAGLGLPAALAQEEPARIDAVERTVESRITAVTLYPGRAAVTRTTTLMLQPDLYGLRFPNLPQSIQPQTLQARAEGPARVIGVDFEVQEVKESASPRIAELEARLLQLRRWLQQIEEQHKVNAAQGKLIDDISVRVAADASKEGGTPALDLEALRAQIAFLAEQRDGLMVRRLELDERKRQTEEDLRLAEAERNSIAGGSRQVRSALVTVAVTAPSELSIALSYLVAEASWSPSYNIRAATDNSSVEIEYDALMWQRTGEDWDAVAMTLSTAQPAMAANPPMIEPWYVDVLPQLREEAQLRGRMPATAAAEPIDKDQADARFYAKRAEEKEFLGRKLEELSRDAEVGGGGPSVTFALPRTVTVKSSAQKQQRTRIASLDTRPEFVHVAVPSLTNAVYVRGELTNTSSYQFLPGPASIFIGQDYIGPTQLGSVAPQGRFQVHFGIDPAVTASRSMLSRTTSNTGLFAVGRRTSDRYRLELDNGAGRPITVELWDRQPVSRSDQIKIELADLSHKLAGDAEYVEEQQPQGLLKWLLSVPAGASGKSALAVTYELRVNRDKDTEITPLPE